jgi:uncharacterized protein YihD (DUF1040 family)
MTAMSTKQRDPKRIPEMLEALRAVWEKNPDLRLMQLIVNACHASAADLFYYEDDELLKGLRAFEGSTQIKASR